MTTLGAIDIIFGVFKAAWDVTGFHAEYTDQSTVQKDDEPWARATLAHATGQQASLGNANGVKRYTEQGTVTIQVFTPAGGGRTLCYELATAVRDAYRDSNDSDVWFKDSKIEEVGESGAFYQINVRSTFSYDNTR